MELEESSTPLAIATTGLRLVSPVTPVNPLLESGSVRQRVGVVLHSRFYCSVSSGISDGVNSGKQRRSRLVAKDSLMPLRDPSRMTLGSVGPPGTGSMIARTRSVSGSSASLKTFAI